MLLEYVTYSCKRELQEDYIGACRTIRVIYRLHIILSADGDQNTSNTESSE